MNNFNLNLFKYFYYVVYYNGFSNASRKLNVAQSALSYNLKQLENQLNKNLVIRDNKNFELTEEGNNLYESIKPIFEKLDKNLVQFHNSSVHDEITIGIRHSLSDYIFKDCINEFIKKYPNIHLNIKLYSKLDIKKFDEEYDLVIDYEDYSRLLENADSISLCKLENILVANKDLAKEYKNVHSLRELNHAPMISMSPNKKNGKFQMMCYDNEMLFDSVISINSCALCKKLIIDGIGICLINKNNVIEELASGEIKELKINEKLFDDNILISYHNNYSNYKVKLFIDMLVDEYKEVSNNG